MKQLKFSLLLLFSILTITASGKGENNPKPKKNHAFTVASNLEIFSAIYKNLDMMYVDSLDADVTIGEGISSMLRSLDPYTEYYPAEEVQNLKTMLTGKYAGIGALIRRNMKIGATIIDAPYEGMPAHEAGLRKGDIIISIDDSTMVNKDVSYVSSHLRGEPGTTFLLTVKRPALSGTVKTATADTKKNNDDKKKNKGKKGKGKPEYMYDEVEGEILKFKITRKAIQLPSVPYYGFIKTADSIQTAEKVGYIMLTQFTDNCARDVRRAIVDMRQKGMTSLIFDLRDNGGGSLSEAIDIVNMFVPKNITLVTTEGKIKRSNRTYNTTSEPLDTIMPLVILVNGNTASASEITSGSMQDLDRAVIMGSRTFGKGLVQQTIDLPHDASLKLTISKYFIPSGRCIQAINYKHTGGGYREHIPDSLTHVFKTRNGRTVRDGGGIKPDIEVKADSVPNIVAYLYQGGLDSTEVMLNYITDYIITHKEIAPADQFHLSDAEFADLKNRIITSGFTYDRGTSKVYEQLVSIAKFEGYYEDSKSEFEALKNKLQHNLSREIDNNRDAICRIVEQEIITAYYFQKGAISYSVNYDNQIAEALKLLLDKEAYNKVLTPAK